MIDALSMRLAVHVKALNPEETPSLEIMRYGIKFMIFNLITALAITVTALLFGNFEQALLCMISFAILRSISGGYHIKTAGLCAIASASMIQCSILLGEVINKYNNMELIIGIVTLILVSIFAPSNIEEQTRIPKKYHGWLKVISVSLVLLNILWINNILLASGFFIQSLTLINTKNREG